MDIAYKPVWRASCETRTTRDIDKIAKLLAAASRIATRDPNGLIAADGLHVTGIGLLCAGNGAAAISVFEHALRANAHSDDVAVAIGRVDDSSLLADAAAAFETSAMQHHREDHGSAALAASSRALRIDPRNPSALFTRALELERLELREDARIAWKRYLQVDAKSGWSEEARTHLSGLPAVTYRHASDTVRVLSRSTSDLSRVARSAPHELASVMEAEGVGNVWAQAVLRHDVRSAANVLAAMLAAADIIASMTDDPRLQETLNTLDDTASSDAASTFRTYARAVAAYKALNVREAERLLDSVTRRLGDSPAVFAVLIRKSSCRFYQNDFRGALAVANDVLARAPRRYHAVRGQAAWLAGLCQFGLASPQESLASYATALGEFQTMRDAGSIAAVETLLAEEYQHLGDADSALTHRRIALRSAYESGNALRLSMALSEAAAAALDRGNFDEARTVFERLVAVSRDADDAMMAIDAAMSYGRLLATSSAKSSAAAVFRDAFAKASAQPEAGVRDRLMATITLRAAEAGVPLQTPLDSAIEFFSTSRNNMSLADCLIVRAQSRAAHEPLVAEDDLRAGLRLIDHEIEGMNDPVQRESYLQRRQAFFDTLVSLLMQHGRTEQARVVADRAHDTLLATYRQPDSRASTRATMIVPPGTALLEFFIAGEHVFYWITSDSGKLAGTLPVTADRLRRQTHQLADELRETHGDRAATLLRTLDGEMLEPVLSRAGRISRLVIVPDGVLFGVPFAALMSRDGRHRIEQFTVETDVSARHFLGSSDAVHESSACDDVTIIGIGEGFDAEPSLPEVKGETAALRQLYPRADVRTLIRNARELTSIIGRHAIAHIATHGIADQRRPLSSGLRLGRSATATALEVATSQFSATRLVFAATCSSNAAPNRRSGVGNVAVAFLAAGVPAVVGTLWDVDDAEAREMSVGFHAALLGGATPRDALRNSQIAFVNRHRQASYGWASYVLLGAAHINERRTDGFDHNNHSHGRRVSGGGAPTESDDVARAHGQVRQRPREYAGGGHPATSRVHPSSQR